MVMWVLPCEVKSAVHFGPEVRISQLQTVNILTQIEQQKELSVVKFLKLTICVCLRIFGCVYYPLLSAA